MERCSKGRHALTVTLPPGVYDVRGARANAQLLSPCFYPPRQRARARERRPP
jgi:hypothetical protein